MSRYLEPNFWRQAIRDHGPNCPTTRATLLMLSTFMNRDGIAYPSQETLAAATCFHANSVQRAIKRANSEGWIWIESQKSEKGRGWRKNTYIAVVPDTVPLSAKAQASSDRLAAYYGSVEGQGATPQVGPHDNRPTLEVVRQPEIAATLTVTEHAQVPHETLRGDTSEGSWCHTRGGEAPHQEWHKSSLKLSEEALRTEGHALTRRASPVKTANRIARPKTDERLDSDIAQVIAVEPAFRLVDIAKAVGEHDIERVRQRLVQMAVHEQAPVVAVGGGRG